MIAWEYLEAYWDYRTSGGAQALQNFMNQIGLGGWELVAKIPFPDDSKAIYLTFKRPMAEPTTATAAHSPIRTIGVPQ